MAQVRNLYGPLLACVTASKSAFDAMCRQHSPDGSSKTFIDAIRSDPGSREGHIYRCSEFISSLHSHCIGNILYPWAATLLQPRNTSLYLFTRNIVSPYVHRLSALSGVVLKALASSWIRRGSYCACMGVVRAGNTVPDA